MEIVTDGEGYCFSILMTVTSENNKTGYGYHQKKDRCNPFRHRKHNLLDAVKVRQLTAATVLNS